MTRPDKLYESWRQDGSYMSHMLVCGGRYNDWVELALHYLPMEILDRYKERLVFLSTAEMDACRVARYHCETREIILLSERILPKQGARADQAAVRYFIFAVLHEIAHVVMAHRSPKYDHLSPTQNRAQEQEADMLAFNWFNAHLEESEERGAARLTQAEVEAERTRNRRLMERLYRGPL